MERNRSESADRIKVGKVPAKGEGRSGDTRHCKTNGGEYYYYRAGNNWYRIKAERV